MNVPDLIAIDVLFLLMLVFLNGTWLFRQRKSLARTRQSIRMADLFNQLNDGIVIMDQDRIITFVNPAAKKMTGWSMGGIVPFCEYCQKRTIPPGERRCLLADDLSRQYFESQIATIQGGLINVGMSRTFLDPTVDGRREMVITIRDTTAQHAEAALRLTRQLAQRSLEIQDEERSRVSLELHDGITQDLFSIQLGIEHVRRNVRDPALKDQITALGGRLAIIQDDVRILSHQLYPALLQERNLPDALRSLAQSMSTSECHIDFTCAHTEGLDWNIVMATHLYRIAQEALHNAMSHGSATQLQISLRRTDDILQMMVTDNGSGFEQASSAAIDSGFGIRNMRERALAMGADLSISSRLGEGTQVTVTLTMRPEGAT